VICLVRISKAVTLGHFSYIYQQRKGIVGKPWFIRLAKNLFSNFWYTNSLHEKQPSKMENTKF